VGRYIPKVSQTRSYGVDHEIDTIHENIWLILEWLHIVRKHFYFATFPVLPYIMGYIRYDSMEEKDEGSPLVRFINFDLIFGTVSSNARV
jgi:hypothetical protein